MLYGYAKNVAGNLSNEQLERLKKFVEASIQ